MQPQGELVWSRATAGQNGGARKEPRVQMEEHQEGCKVQRLWPRCVVRATCTPECFPGMGQQEY